MTEGKPDKNERIYFRPFEGATPEISRHIEMIEERFPTLDPIFRIQLAVSISKSAAAYGCLYNGQREDIEKYGLAIYLDHVEKEIHKMYKAGTFPRKQESGV